MKKRQKSSSIIKPMKEMKFGMNNKNIWTRLLFGWIGISILVLAFSLYLLNGQKESEVAGTMTFIMFVMSFPSGWLGYALETSMLDYFAQKQMYIYDTRSVLLLAWAIFFVIGCIQWVILAKIAVLLKKQRQIKSHKQF